MKSNIQAYYLNKNNYFKKPTKKYKVKIEPEGRLAAWVDSATPEAGSDQPKIPEPDVG